MRANVIILSSVAKRSERASDRTAPERTDGRATDVEIASIQKKLSDMAIGMRNLRALKPAPFDLEGRVLAHAQKINALQTKLFKLRQMRLL